MKKSCGLVLQPTGLVRDEQIALIVLDHQDHRSEEKRNRKEQCVKQVQEQREEQKPGSLAQTRTSKDAVKSEVLVKHFAILKLLAADPAPFGPAI